MGGLRRRQRIVGGAAPAAAIQGGGVAPEVCVDLGPLLSPGWDRTFGDPRFCIHRGRVYGQGTIVTDGSLDGLTEIVPPGGLPPQFRPSSPASVSLWNDSLNSDDADENSSWPAVVNPDGGVVVAAGGGFGNLPRGEVGTAMHFNTCVYDLSAQPDNPPFETLGPYMGGGDYSDAGARVGADGRVHFDGQVAAQNDHASQIVPFPQLPAKYVPDSLVAGKVFDSHGQAWTAQGLGGAFGGAVQLVQGSAQPHTFHLVTASGYAYTHTDYQVLLDDSFGKNQRLVQVLPVHDANASFSPPRNDWVEVNFGVSIDAAAVEGEGAGAILAYDSGNYYAVVAVVKAARMWRYEVWKITGGSGALLSASASYAIPGGGDLARQTADVWTNAFGTQLEFRERSPGVGHIVTDGAGFDSHAQVGLIDLLANGGGVSVVPELRAQSVYSYDTPAAGTLVTLDTLGWDAKGQNVPPVTPGSFSATVGAGGIRRE